MNILALGAHPDDVEVLCGGTLFKYKKAGHKIFIALTTSGNQGSNVLESREEIAAVREKEQLAAAKMLDAEVRFMRFDDQLIMDTRESRKAVINAIRWANPDVIFTNYPEDPSTDHSITGTIVSRVILSLPGKNVYADEKPIQKKPSVFFWDVGGCIDFSPEVYVDITETMEQKMAAIACHESQVSWVAEFTEDFMDYCRCQSRIRGIQAGCKYAEGFRAYRIFGFMPDYKLLP